MTILFEVSIAEKWLVIFCRSESVQGLISTFIFVTAVILMIIKPISRCKSPSLVFQVGKSWYYASNLDLLVTKSITVGNRDF
jgi:hypothetical protein